MSRIAAEYVEGDAALNAARKLVDEGIDPQDIEIRSPYPLAEPAIPPHRSENMIMRNVVRFMWLVGGTAGFSFLTWTQHWWNLKTDWQPVVSIPINGVITYECAMITAIFTTTFMFFWETRKSRRLTPPLEEDLPVANGHVVVIVHGESAGKAESILKESGYRSLVPFVAMIALLGVLSSGCGKYKTLDWNKHNMRDQQVIKPTEASEDTVPAGTIPMPTRLQQEVLPPSALGWVTPEELSDPKIHFLQPTPEELKMKNPVEADALSLSNGKRLYETNCAFCHGKTGVGDGPVGEVYSPKPANLAGKDSPIARKPDGSFYHWIVVGKSTMPPFGWRLASVEIFDIINYLRYMHGGGSPDAIKTAWRKDLHFGMGALNEPAELRTGRKPAAQSAPTAAPTEPTPAPEPSPAAAPEPASPSPAASPAAPQASAAQIAAAGIPDTAKDFPGVAEVATMTLKIDAGLAAKGREIYMGAGTCNTCHGDNADGQGPAGAALDPKPRNLLAKAEYKYGTSDAAIYRTVEYGVPGTGMAAMGLEQGGTLSPEEVQAVVAYVKSVMK